MGKLTIGQRVKKIDANGKKMTKKDQSHGTYRAKRHPNSKRVKQRGCTSSCGRLNKGDILCVEYWSVSVNV